jgi:hypothetical protein
MTIAELKAPLTSVYDVFAEPWFKVAIIRPVA